MFQLISQTSDWYNLSDEEMKMYLDQIQVPGNANRIDLSVSHFLKINTDSEDTVKMRSSLALDTYDYVLAAVNNREDETREGGTHWSLLVYTRESNTYYHLDSVEPLNCPHAQRLAVALSGDPDVNVVQMQCRQLKSGVECGGYVVHYIELTCSMIVNISIKAFSDIPSDFERATVICRENTIQ
ncbi:sentrin-specific protease 8-like [Homalodisca vitripennis]|uniref:sentrin-specific protease 8-like n=1 Tax=Homalodisca vitripennis TaxID=197043 RepID=UPI001EEA9A88|nr:sentrin-specific protease 8-like [Homalodisca vitripennis]